MDAFTKQILAHVVSLSLTVDFVLEAVQQLIEKHGSELNTDALVHSDQGTHYTSFPFVEILNDHDLRQSMSRKANCWDNAPQESLFGHMKEEIHILPSDTHVIIARKIDDWVDYYNNDRYQWGLTKLSPNEFYQYVKTGDYPLPVSLSAIEVCNATPGGSAPGPPEFIALVSGEGDESEERNESDDAD